MSRLRKVIWVFKKLRHVADKNLLTGVYIALAQSVLSYCIPVWGGACKIKLLEVERTQRSLLKVMHFLPYRFPTDRLYAYSDLLTIRQLYILNCILKLHKTLSYNPEILTKRRIDRVFTTNPVKTAYAAKQYLTRSTYLYKIINKKVNIYNLPYYDCKKKLTIWLKSLSYTETENLLKKII